MGLRGLIIAAAGGLCFFMGVKSFNDGKTALGLVILVAGVYLALLSIVVFKWEKKPKRGVYF